MNRPPSRLSPKLVELEAILDACLFRRGRDDKENSEMPDRGKPDLGARLIRAVGTGAAVAATGAAIGYGIHTKGGIRRALTKGKALRHLYALNPGMIELGGMSLGTTKKVLAGLRQRAGDGLTHLRPSGTPLMGMYVPKGVGAAPRAAIADMHSLPAGRVQPHSVITPRMSTTNRRDIAGIFPDSPLLKASPRAIGIHEHGHAADPLLGRYSKAQQAAGERFQGQLEGGDMTGAEKLGNKMARSAMRVEKRANSNVLRQVETHGTPAEAAEWKKMANAQMKTGYRNPLYQQAVEQTGADSLSQKKGILKQYPYLRSRFTNLAACLEALSLALT